MLKKKIRVLIIDDSALIREVLSKGLAMDPSIEVVGTASDPYVARDKIVYLTPDVLTLDVEMPRMNGVEFLKKLMPQYPLPVVMVSSLTQKGKKITIEALEAGAVDFVTKPTTDIARGLASMIMELRTKIKIAATANVSHWKKSRPTVQSNLVSQNHTLTHSKYNVIAIGASTGGTEAIRKIITTFPTIMPSILIVQHMPPGFTKMFADRLNQLSLLEVKEAVTGDQVIPGRVLIAPGDAHMTIKRSGGVYNVICSKGEKVNGHCPSVDVLMYSVAKEVGQNSIGIILTGMGGDGAKGLLAMRKTGAKTLAQDEKTSVVFGMPKVAYEIGAAEKLCALDDITPEIIKILLGCKY